MIDGRSTLQALTVIPGMKDPLQLREIPDRPPGQGSVLVGAVAVRPCGTDLEFVAAVYGHAPMGESFLVLGGENLGRVKEALTGSGYLADDLVLGIVRRPDTVACPAWAQGQWDICRDGQCFGQAIKGRHGLARKRWSAEPVSGVRIDKGLAEGAVPLEPTTIAAKAREQIDRIAGRALVGPKVAVVTGYGPVGLLATLIGVQRELEVHLSNTVRDSPKPDLVGDLATIHHKDALAGSGVEADVLVEWPGVSFVVLETLTCGATDPITCLNEVSITGGKVPADIGLVNRDAVLGTDVIYGSVNANRGQYATAAKALELADSGWLGLLITRLVVLAYVVDAYTRRGDGVKVVLEVRER
jgi:glucose 1-dehydrogenase